MGEFDLKKHGFFQITQKVFIRKKNLLLVLRDRKSQIGDLPGGRISEDEFFADWLMSVRRELVEELGGGCIINVEAEPFLVNKHIVEDGKHPCIILAYKAEFVSGQVVISEEHDLFEWVDVFSYKPETLFKGFMLEVVQKYLYQCKTT